MHLTLKIRNERKAKEKKKKEKESVCGKNGIIVFLLSITNSRKKRRQ